MIPLSRPLIGDAEQEAVLRVLSSGQLASGPMVQAFEAAFADFVACRYAVATANGTAALAVALQAAGVRPGDQVVTTAFSFIATANAILHVGAQPVFADIDPDTFNVSADTLARALRAAPGARAVLVVHLYGQPCDMDPILDLVRSRNLLLIEDCAQAHGATYRGRPVGSFGDAAAFSFYATKNMTTGEGGMVTTSRPEVADVARRLVNHGRVGAYCHDRVGYNYRMTDLAAAIGLVQLRRLPEMNRIRAAHAAALTKGLAGLAEVVTPQVAPHRTHVFHQYTIRTPRRDELAEWLKGQGVASAAIYPCPLHRQPAYRDWASHYRLPAAEQAAAEVLSLPVHPGLGPGDVEHIVAAVRAFYP